LAVRKTAVPGTRVGGCSDRLARKERSDGAFRYRRSNITARPRRQVDISMNTTAAMTSGNQPPANILSALAERKVRSMTRNAPNTATTSAGFQPQPLWATIPASTASIAMAALTAMP
jgi:hypothetical protein